MVNARFVTDNTVVNVRSEQQTASVNVTPTVIGGRVGVSSYPTALSHDKLSDRDISDQHPVSAITGLQDSLEGLSGDIIAENERATAAEENLQNQIDDITASAVTDIIGGSNVDVERNERSVTINTSTFVFEQGIASDTWIINHNLNKRPSIQLVDSSGRGFEADREYTNNNQVIIHLQSATTGFAYLN